MRDYQAVYDAKVRAFRDCERKALSLQQIPSLVMQEFERVSRANNMAKKQYFYEMSRQAGTDIPPYNEIHKSGGF